MIYHYVLIMFSQICMLMTQLFIILTNLKNVLKNSSGYIRVREMSGKFKIFQGQGIVREFHNLSGKIEFLLKCQGNLREF